jgi:hypothetical protein
MIRKEFTGMLPAAIDKFEELLADSADLNPVVVSGYDATAGHDSFFYWGVACRITADDMATLRTAAEALSILWLPDDGDIAYTDGLSIDDFQTYRVNGNLELMPEKEGM